MKTIETNATTTRRAIDNSAAIAGDFAIRSCRLPGATSVRILLLQILDVCIVGHSMILTFSAAVLFNVLTPRLTLTMNFLRFSSHSLSCFCVDDAAWRFWDHRQRQ
jgi:hypothetical protein